MNIAFPYDKVVGQIERTREIIADRFGQKRYAPTLTYRIPNADGETQRAMELGINIGWIEGLEYVKRIMEEKKEDTCLQK